MQIHRARITVPRGGAAAKVQGFLAGPTAADVPAHSLVSTPLSTYPAACTAVSLGVRVVGRVLSRQGKNTQAGGREGWETSRVLVVARRLRGGLELSAWVPQSLELSLQRHTYLHDLPSLETHAFISVQYE